MSSRESEVEEAGAWAELWQRASDGFIGGVQHALNNRVAALSAVAQVLGAGMADAQVLVQSLAHEVERLQSTVSLLSFLRRAQIRAPEPILLPALVEGLLEILPHHSQIRDVRFEVDADPGLLPVLTERDQLTRVVLVLLASAALRAQRGDANPVRVRYRGDEREVRMRVEAGGTGEADRDAPTLDARAVRQPVREMGGEVWLESGPAGGTEYELNLPTLPEARRRERAAAGS